MRTLRLAALFLLAACGEETKSTGDTGAVTGGEDSGETGPVDADGDGYDDTLDCDDADPAVNPGAEETCNGVDDDCDGAVDADDPGVIDAVVFYADADGDGFGAADAPTLACEAGDGLVADATDCDDADAAVHPGADEVCNGADDDCDDAVDEDATDAPTFYIDYDGDGFGSDRFTTTQCAAPSGYVDNADDCDDAEATTNPDAQEVCNAVDDDCDGTTDEDDAADAVTWYADTDGDGHGDAGSVTVACEAPSGFVGLDDDCDDATADVSPSATELCNAVDDDCDGTTDEDDAADAATWYADTDGDGYGDAAATTAACSVPSGYVADATDCDDGASTVSPAATETCNSVDDDCDGTTDEDDASDAATWYLDGDGDGWGEDGTTTVACDQPSGYEADGGDCDDGDADVNPGVASDTCDGVDSDCDGTTDEDGAYAEDATCPGTSCEDVLAELGTGATDGVYWIDPDGAGAYEVYCDMTTSSGGWTLLGVFTNGDGTVSWSAYDADWVTDTTFGDATTPSVNADAKSEAYNSLNVDEVLITDQGGTVWVQTISGCLGGTTMLDTFQQDSEDDGDCAQACSTVTTASYWAQSRTNSTLKFRCIDNDGWGSSSGYRTANDDNSMLTTLNNASYHDYNFGLGAGYSSSMVDFDYSTDDYGNPGYTSQVLLFGR
jgi:hypothetical protein